MAEPFRAEQAGAWDQLVRTCPATTFLHTRRFLAYHGDRFRDASLVFGGDAVLPAAWGRHGTVVSHPGATFGGLMHRPGTDAQALLGQAIERWRADGATGLVYKPVPHIYHRLPAQGDLRALQLLGARRTRTDLASVVDLADPGRPASRRRRAITKARRAGVEVVSGPEHLASYWKVLREVLAGRHGVAPVHTLAEITLLSERFPEEIKTVVARCEGRVVAGAVLFSSARVVHAQYLASGEEGRAIGALDLVLVTAIQAARERGHRFFDFGRSTEDDGSLNEGLHRYKQEFGGGETLYERYELEL